MRTRIRFFVCLVGVLFAVQGRAADIVYTSITNLPSFSEAYYQFHYDPDISDENVDRYAALAKVKKISVNRGLLLVEFDPPDLDPQIVRSPYQIHYSLTDKIARPKRRYFVKPSGFSGVHRDPRLLPYYEQQAARRPNQHFIRPHLMVVRHRKEAKEGEHLYTYSRDFDVSDANFKKLKTSPDIIRVEPLLSPMFFGYVIYDVWAPYDRAAKQNELIRKLVMKVPPEGYTMGRPHMGGGTLGYGSAAGFRDKYISLSYEEWEHDYVSVHLYHARPPAELSEHLFWGRVIHWKNEIEKIDGNVVIVGSRRPDYWIEGRDYGGPETGVYWQTDGGICIRISWKIGRKRPSRKDAKNWKKERRGGRRPKALIRTYLKRFPSTLSKDVAHDKREWALKELLLGWARAGREIKTGEILRPNGPFPFFYAAFTAGMSQSQRLAVYRRLTPYIEEIRKDDFVWKPEHVSFRLGEEEIRDAPIIELSNPKTVYKPLSQMRNLQIKPTWHVSTDQYPLKTTDRDTAAGSAARHLFFLKKIENKLHLVKMNLHSGEQVGQLALPGWKPVHLKYIKGHIYVATELSGQKLLSVIDPVTLRNDVHTEETRAFKNVKYSGGHGGLGGSLEALLGIQSKVVVGDECFYATFYSDDGWAGKLPDKRRYLYAFERWQHKVRWRATVGKGKNFWLQPIETDGITVIHWLQRGCAAIETSSGKVLWSRPTIRCIGIANGFAVFYTEESILYLVEARTGKSVGKIRLVEAPSSDQPISVRHSSKDRGMPFSQTIQFCEEGILLETTKINRSDKKRRTTFWLYRWPDKHTAQESGGELRPVEAAIFEGLLHTDDGSVFLTESNKKVMPVLLKGLDDSRAEVRLTAVMGLAEVAKRGDRAGSVARDLTKALRDEHPEIRRHAAYALRAYGANAKAAIPDLLDMLDQKDAAMRLKGASLIAAIDPDSRAGARAATVLRPVLNDPDPRKRNTATLSLGKMTSEVGTAQAMVNRKLSHRDPKVRLWTVHALQKSVEKAPERYLLVIPHLVARIREDPDSEVRTMCASALSAYGSLARSARPALRLGMEDEHEHVRRYSIMALTKIGLEKSDFPLLKEHLTDRGFGVAQKAGQALAAFRGEAVPTLIKLLDQDDRKFREAAIYALSTVGEEAELALDPLIAMARGTDIYHADSAVGAIGQIGGRGISVLIEFLNHPNNRIRQTAFSGLHRQGERAAEAVPALIKILEGGNAKDRNWAAFALAGIGPAAESALPVLEKALNDPDRDVKDNAASAIRKIRARNVSAPSIGQKAQSTVVHTLSFSKVPAMTKQEDIAMPAAIPVVRTWDDLLKQNPTELMAQKWRTRALVRPEPKVLTVRLGIESNECPLGSGVLLYALTEGYAVKRQPGKTQLGPLRIRVTRGGEEVSAHQSERARSALFQVSGKVLHFLPVSFDREGIHRIEVFAPSAEVIASIPIEVTQRGSHPWTRLSIHRQKLYYGGFDTVVPSYRNTAPHTVGEEGKQLGDKSLPRFIPPEPASDLQASLQGDRLVLSTSFDMKAGYAAWEGALLLVRWWVNDKPFVPKLDRTWIGGMAKGVYGISQCRLMLSGDPSRIGAEPGDKIAVQFLYCESGWEWPGDHAGSMITTPNEPYRLPRLSQRLDFVAE